MAATSIRLMANTNNLHMADSLTAVTVTATAVMVNKPMVLRSSLTNLEQQLSSSSTERLATTALMDRGISKPTLELLTFPRPVRASNPSTRDTDRLLSLPLAVDMVPDLAMAATEDNLLVLSVVSVATVLVAAMVATTANPTSTDTMSARRLATAVSLVTAMAPTKM